ncbi:MAG TPA: hypothetical protein VJV75_03030 [Candidatus Polarisedimenticolia bacterium]|nr:hypothetical protein [Candidatus Polarisedimenticolia bacterium]
MASAAPADAVTTRGDAYPFETNDLSRRHARGVRSGTEPAIRAAAMMRITLTRESRDTITLRLEGNLDGDSVGLLEREFESLLAGRAAICVDMTAIRFVDRLGTEALRRIGGAGVEIRCRPGVVASVLENEGIGITLAPSNGW